MPRRRNAVTKNVKDYIVPIVGAIIVLFIIFSLFGWSDESTEVQKENRVGILIEKDTDGTTGNIEYLNGSQSEITPDLSFFKGETLQVTNGSIQLDIPEVGNGRLSQLGVLDYNDNGTFKLESWNFWLNLTSKQTVNMQFAKVKLAKNTHVSLSQNEMSSTIYVIDGIAEVQNLWGVSTTVVSWEKLSVSRLQASDSEVDLKGQKESIDDIFRNSEWYILNRGDSYINSSDKSEENQENTNGSNQNNGVINSSRVLLFDTIKDQANVGEASIKVTGKYLDENIVKITANNTEATLNSDNTSFVFENINTSKKVNDIVFRAFDDSGDVLERKLVTLYYQAGEESNNSGYNLKNYEDVDASQFSFTAPSEFTTYTTEFWEVTIKGLVDNDDIAKVLVNGFELGSFTQPSWTWKYHAFERFGTISQWTNVYDVEYYDANDNLVYSNTYTIVKK